MTKNLSESLIGLTEEQVSSIGDTIGITTLDIDVKVFFILFTLGIQINALKLGGDSNDPGLGNKAGSYNIIAKSLGRSDECTNTCITVAFAQNTSIFAPKKSAKSGYTSASKTAAIKEMRTIIDSMRKRRPGKLESNTINQASSTNTKTKHMNGSRAQFASTISAEMVFNYNNYPDLIKCSTVEEVITLFGWTKPEDATVDLLTKKVKELLALNPRLEKAGNSFSIQDPFNICKDDDPKTQASDNLTPLERTLNTYKRTIYQKAEDLTPDVIDSLGDDFAYLRGYDLS